MRGMCRSCLVFFLDSVDLSAVGGILGAWLMHSRLKYCGLVYCFSNTVRSPNFLFHKNITGSCFVENLGSRKQHFFKAFCPFLYENNWRSLFYEYYCCFSENSTKTKTKFRENLPIFAFCENVRSTYFCGNPTRKFLLHPPFNKSFINKR